MTDNEFKKIMAGVADYYNKKLTNSFTLVYWRKFGALSQIDLQNAIDKCMDELSFFPKLPEIAARLPEKPKLEHKGSLSWCDNAQKLLDKYAHKY